MSVTIGIDVQSIDEVDSSLMQFGNRYSQRIYTPSELADVSDSIFVARELAMIFAAKEAVIKALRPTVDIPAWQEIEIHRIGDGTGAVALSGVASQLAEHQEISQWTVRMRHDGTSAIATAVAQRSKDESRGARNDHG
jgi:holo-[acyl-carrier protein] synthase